MRKRFKVGDMSVTSDSSYWIYAGSARSSIKGVGRNHVFEAVYAGFNLHRGTVLKPKNWTPLAQDRYFFTGTAWCPSDEIILVNIFKLKSREKVISVLKSKDTAGIKYVMDCIKNKTIK